MKNLIVTNSTDESYGTWNVEGISLVKPL